MRVDDSHHYYLAGRDKQRTQHLSEALTDKATKAIFYTRGGYGTSRVLPFVTGAQVPSSRILVGYSDATSLNLAALRLWSNVHAIHGPNIATAQLLGDGPSCKMNRESLHNALFDKNYGFTEHVEFLVPGCASGPITGGCLTLVAAATGTPFALDATDKILFLEDTGESPYKIDRMITQLKNAGSFNSVRGVVFGVMRKCVDPYNDLRDVLKDLLEPLGIPISIGFRSGHGEVNLSVPFGSQMVLDHELGTVEVSPIHV